MSDDLFENLLANLSPEDLREQRDRYLSQAEDLRQRAEAVERLLSIQARLQPSESKPASKEGQREQTVNLTDLVREMERPSITAAILRVMEGGSSAAAWSAEEVLRQLTERGWAPTGLTPKNSVAAMLSRLRKRGAVDRVGPGLYRLAAYRPQGSPSEATEGDEPQLRVEEGR